MTKHPSARNPWPTTIIASFALFIAGLATFIVFASRQQMDLVRPDYYEEEVHYQQQLDRLNRANALGSELAIAYQPDQHSIRITLPTTHSASPVTGHIHFYRPSDARLDHQLPLTLDPRGIQSIDATALAPGPWKIRVQWKLDEHEYAAEQNAVILAPAS